MRGLPGKRIVYFGTPSDAVPPLRALVTAGHDIALVVTQPDRRRGRGNEMVPSAVKQCAFELGLAVATPEKSREIVADVSALDAELGVVVAFGQLLPPALLASTRSGFINLHFSLLPRWRGAAPVERAMLTGDSDTGVALMAMEEGLDTGGIFAEVRVPITDTITAGELRADLVKAGTEMLVRELDNIPTAVPRVQVGEPTYAHKLTVAEFRLDPQQSARSLARVVRAGNPKPGAWTTIEGRRLKVLRAHVVASSSGVVGEVTRDCALQCRDGALEFDEVQPDGKRRMEGAAWIAGLRGSVMLDG